MRDLKTAIARFGAEAKAKLSIPAVSGEPEDQLRDPLVALFADLAEICGFKRDQLVAVGETPLSALQTRPDYAITQRNVLVGFVEVKAPGKGADPRRDSVLYTDGAGPFELKALSRPIRQPTTGIRASSGSA